MEYIKSFIDKIPQNSRIALLGAGITGVGLKKYIDENRKDIKVVCFLDSFEEGEKDGLSIVNLAEINEHKNEFDLVVCSTRKAIHELVGVLGFYDIPNILIDTYIEKYYHLDIEKHSLYKKALEIFKQSEDKDLYEIIWKHRINPYRLHITNYAKKHNISRDTIPRNYDVHYLEYINKGEIKTVIDGGFCNGIHSLGFKKNFKNLKKVYAFEPMYEEFKNPVYDKIIKSENFCEIVNLGLWEEEKNLSFAQNIKAPAWSRVLADGENVRAHEKLININVTSIDCFKKQRNIEKVDFIKMDIEGAELPALKGGMKTITEDRPQLAISIYHSLDDLVNIPIYLNENLKDYTFKLGHYSYNRLESVLYAIPNELL